MKQVIISMVVVLLAAGLFAGMVIYSVSVMRQTQLRILVGELASVQTGYSGKYIVAYCA